MWCATSYALTVTDWDAWGSEDDWDPTARHRDDIRERSPRKGLNWLPVATLAALLSWAVAMVFAGVYALIGTVQVALDASLIGPIQAVTATALVTVGALVTGWAVFSWTSRR